MRTIAPAKINWTLEVLGRREDGYHEIRSVMQTIDLCDLVQVWPDADAQPVERPADLPEGEPGVEVRVSPVCVYWRGESEEGADPWTAMAYRAASLLDPSEMRGAGIELTKRIPVASGLGGGSSDAAGALRALERLWGLSLGRGRLAEMAAELGSDVPFFLYGGTALAEGRGERVTPLPDAPAMWLVLVVSQIRLPEKTKRMYKALVQEDFTDGSLGTALAERLRQGEAVRGDDLYNVFERAAYEVFDGLQSHREALLSAGAHLAHLAGAGPTLFTVAESEARAREIADRVEAPGAKVFIARTLTAAEAIFVTD